MQCVPVAANNDGDSATDVNAFVAWCKDARKCVRALSENNETEGKNDEDSSAGIGERGASSSAVGNEQRTGRGTEELYGYLRRLCERAMERMKDCWR